MHTWARCMHMCIDCCECIWNKWATSLRARALCFCVLQNTFWIPRSPMSAHISPMADACYHRHTVILVGIRAMGWSPTIPEQLYSSLEGFYSVIKCGPDMNWLPHTYALFIPSPVLRPSHLYAAPKIRSYSWALSGEHWCLCTHHFLFVETSETCRLLDSIRNDVT